MTTKERFWSHVAKGDGCWLWTACVVRRYGQFGPFRAHRYAWALSNGPVPAGMFVCHRCDTPLCVRPSHLFLGTHLDNMRDMTAKGRQATGENHGEAKLTEDAVRLIRSSGETLSILAARYGVDRSLIHQVRHHQIWRHVR